MLTERCLCGDAGAGGRYETIHGVEVLACRCGVKRQVVRMSPDDYARWYQARYLEEFYSHSYEQDVGVAKARLAAYQIEHGTSLLDVGCGNGAFVDTAREFGIDAWGQDLSSSADGPHGFAGPLEQHVFPTGVFQTVTMHDVLEHVPDPRAMLREVSRILPFGGRLIVDFPRFHEQCGAHHWKPVEHLWMLDETQLISLLESEGFSIDRIEHPIDSKVVVYATSSRVPSSARIIVPPGIGDGWWVMVKMRAFFEERGLWLPELFVHDSGPRRAGEMWERFPLVRFGGYAKLPEMPPQRMPRQVRSGRPRPRGVPPNPWMHRAYQVPGFGVQEDVPGFDYFMSANGSIDNGWTLDRALPWESCWYEPLHVTKADLKAEARLRETFGPRFVVSAFWEPGYYASFLQHFGEDKIAKMLRYVMDHGYRVVMMGAGWDKGGIASRLVKATGCDSLIGQTNFGELLALLRACDGVLGFPAGNTMLGTYARRPTVLMWHHFPQTFWRTTIPPDANYRPIACRGAQPESVARTLLAMMAAERLELQASAMEDAARAVGSARDELRTLAPRA